MYGNKTGGCISHLTGNNPGRRGLVDLSFLQAPRVPRAAYLDRPMAPQDNSVPELSMNLNMMVTAF